MKKKVIACIIISAACVILSTAEGFYINSVCDRLYSETESEEMTENINGLEKIISENETLLSLFLNNADIMELKISAEALKSDFEGGLPAFREKIIDLREKLRPTVKNIF